jgi:SPP1 gp7 family putative phage head morphogenesis protein
VCSSDLSKGAKLLDKPAAKKSFKEAALPSMSNAMLAAYKLGQELITPTSPHKAIDPTLNKYSLAWLKRRIGWAADAVISTLEEDLRAALIAGFENGESIPQIAARIADQFGPVRAERIARTEIMQASNYGNIEGYKDAGVEECEFYTALDERVCEDCDDMNGDVESADDAQAIGILHPDCRCHPGDTLIDARDIQRAYRRWYEGDLIDITTARGHKLSCTPNHPILTDAGWVAAGLLLEGNNVISRRVSQGMGGSNPNIDYVPTAIGQIFESLAVMCPVERMPGLPMDFHNDGGKQQVDIITVNNGLLQGFVSAGFQQGADLILSPSHGEMSLARCDGTFDRIGKSDSVSGTH